MANHAYFELKPSDITDLKTALADFLDPLLERVLHGNPLPKPFSFVIKEIGGATTASKTVDAWRDGDSFIVNGVTYAVEEAFTLGTQVIATRALAALVGAPLGPIGVLVTSASELVWSALDESLNITQRIERLFGQNDYTFKYTENGVVKGGALYDNLGGTSIEQAIYDLGLRFSAKVGATIDVSTVGKDQTFSVMSAGNLAEAMGVAPATFNSWNWGKSANGKNTTNGQEFIMGHSDGPDFVHYVDTQATVALKIWSADGRELEQVSVSVKNIGFGAPPENAVAGPRFIIGTAASDAITALGSQPAYIIGNGGDGDILTGWDGNDRIIAGTLAASDPAGSVSTLEGNGGNDLLIGNGGINIAKGGLDNDVIIGYGGNDSLMGEEGDDIIYGDHYFDMGIRGGEDTIEGGTGIDRLHGGDKNDKIYANSADKASDGVADYLWGGTGNDDFFVGSDLSIPAVQVYEEITGEYIYNIDVRGKFDVIRDYQTSDTIFVAFDDTEWGLGYNYTEFKYTLEPWYKIGEKQVYEALGDHPAMHALYDKYFDENLNETIEVLLFFEPELYTPIFAIEQRRTIDLSPLTGTEADDNLAGSTGSDLIQGKRGNDLLAGGAGSDTYSYSRGDGNDRIAEASGRAGDRDTLRFEDVDRESVTATRSGNNLVVTISAAGHSGGVSRLASNAVADEQTVIILDQFDPNGDGTQGIEEIVFADGIVWDRTTIMSVPDEGPVEPPLPTPTIDGTSGDDTLVGSWTDDIIRGGAGNDLLIGEWGSDTYLFNAGDGHDTIQDWDDPTSTDVLQLGAGLTRASVSVERGPNIWDVVLNFGTAGSVTIANGFLTSSSVIEEVRFADGTVWLQEDLRARYLATAGTDADQIIYGFIDRDDVIEGKGGNDDINGMDGDDTILGGAGYDTLFGGAGNDTLDGGADSDTMIGNAGSDTYLYANNGGYDYINDEDNTATDVDVLKFVDLNEADVDFMRSGLSLVITSVATGETVFIENQFNPLNGGFWGVERIEFANGGFLDYQQINEVGQLRGTAGDDTIVGTWKQEILSGGAGNDTLIGEWGSDTYVFNAGDGHDTIQDWNDPESTDVLQLGAGIDVASTSVQRGTNILDVVLNFGAAGSVTIANGFDTASSVIEEVRFADGTIWHLEDLRSNYLAKAGTAAGETIYGFDDRNDVIEGGAGNDDLNGQGGNDILRGGDGDDFLVGGDGNDILEGGTGNDGMMLGAGNDVLVFRPNFSHDWVSDFLAGAGTEDIIEFSTDLFEDFQSVLAAASQSGGDTIITFDGNNSITLANVATSSLHADDFRFVA